MAPLAAVAVAVLLAAVAAVTARTGAWAAEQSTVEYAATDDDLANPERGLYRHTECAANAFSAGTLRRYRTDQNISLVLCVFYLDGFQDRDLDAATLGRLGDRFTAVREAGLKMVVRFAYTADSGGGDAPVDRVLRHLQQLAPVLRANADVLAHVQAGFVGAWGEWYYTTHFGNAGRVTAANQADRRRVVEALLAAVPPERAVALRTPAIKQAIAGSQALAPERAHDGSAAARLGHHNDCFLASADDLGTYADPRTEKPYLAAETASVPMGGETCAVNQPRSGCAAATAELAQFHWTYLNTDYHPDVLAGWSREGCLAEVRRRLGYRLALTRATFPTGAAPGGALPIRLTVRNDGYAAPVNPRPVGLVLRDVATGATREVPLDADARDWAPGARTVEVAAALPADLPPGDYALALHLPDPAAGLAGRPEYAIRLAHATGWDAATGVNDLGHVVAVR